MARRMMKEGGEAAVARINYGYRLATSHMPSNSELEEIQIFYRGQLANLKKNPQEAVRILGGPAETNESDAAEQAAFTMVANVLLNLDEAVTKE